jgi:Predicted signal-transduction protein containing cAMP-binding and CBS domains
MTKCSEVMTKDPAVCMPGDLVTDVARVMKKEDVGPIPIVEDKETRRLVGMVTDRDLVLRMVAEGRDTKTTKAEEVMSLKLVTCHADDDVQEALDAMSENQLRRIPVVDDKNRIIGIIAQADVATRVNQPEKTAAMVKKISRSKKK